MIPTFLHQKLVADLEGDTHGDFEDLLVALVTPPAVYDCHEVIRAIKVRLCQINFKMLQNRVCIGLLMHQCSKKQTKMNLKGAETHSLHVSFI